MIAPILLPLFALLSTLLPSGAPVAEWHIPDETRSDRWTFELKLMPKSGVALGKLSLTPVGWEDAAFEVVPVKALPSEVWARGETTECMWHTPPALIECVVHAATPPPPHAEVRMDWEQLRDGERERWKLGAVAPSGTASTASTASTWPPQGTRLARATDSHAAEVTLRMTDLAQGTFVKWTEHVPPTCACEVLDADGATVRQTANDLIFIWFETPSSTPELFPKYRLTCMKDVLIERQFFDGFFEVAFGTETETSHIAEVEWDVDLTARNENMKLNPASSVAEEGAGAHSNAPHARSQEHLTKGLQYAVQVLAVHRDLDQEELEKSLNFRAPFHIERHDGWHKYVTDFTATYSDAHAMRQTIWATTNATDAFVTASLEGERITVQEALLLSNQTWIP